MFGTVRSGRPFYLLGRRMEREDLRMKIKNYCSFLLKRIIPSFRQNCKKYTEAVFPKPEKLKYEIPIELVVKYLLSLAEFAFETKTPIHIEETSKLKFKMVLQGLAGTLGMLQDEDS